MTTLIAQLEKEISKASKAFHKANSVMQRLKCKEWNKMSDVDFNNFSKASEDYQKYDSILTALYPMLEKVKSFQD